MTDKYITSSQYREGLYSIKEYVDKSIPHREDPEVLFTLSADKVLEIYNSTNKSMEFDKPSNIDLNSNFIISYNNEDIIGNIGKNDNVKYIFFNSNDINIMIYLGYDINYNANENKMVVHINMLNTASDLILKQIKTKYLNNKYLKKDVAIQNSITIGTRLKNKDIGIFSFSNGNGTVASGNTSHVEGFWSTASGEASHAEGTGTTASGEASHAEGTSTIASGEASHAEGTGTTASGNYSHAEGYYSEASGIYSHVEGNWSTASGGCSHAEGVNTKASGNQSHAEGYNTISSSES